MEQPSLGSNSSFAPPCGAEVHTHAAFASVASHQGPALSDHHATVAAAMHFPLEAVQRLVELDPRMNTLMSDPPATGTVDALPPHPHV